MPALGFEPRTNGLRIRCSSQLSYTGVCTIKLCNMRLTGFEPAVYELKARCHTTWLQTQNIKLLLLKFLFSFDSHNFSPYHK